MADTLNKSSHWFACLTTNLIGNNLFWWGVNHCAFLYNHLPVVADDIIHGSVPALGAGVGMVLARKTKIVPDVVGGLLGSAAVCLLLPGMDSFGMLLEGTTLAIPGIMIEKFRQHVSSGGPNRA